MMNIADCQTGYAHARYAKSLAAYGDVVHLPVSDGYVLARDIPGSACRDAMGLYPLFSCANWVGLKEDIDHLHAGPVSLVMVPDPFGAFDVTILRSTFPDLMVPFKQHHVIDLSRPIDSFVSSHHRRNVRKAKQLAEVEVLADPAAFLDDWASLYDNLVRRHSIDDMRAFSQEAFQLQFSVPGIRVFRAVRKDRTIGMLVWYINNGVATYHLGAYSDEGYMVGASFALFDTAIRHFSAAGLEWMNLQAEGGIRADGNDGLARFKAGWSNGTRQAWLCGKILNRDSYAGLVQAGGKEKSGYFPAYRYGEFIQGRP